MKFSTMIAAFAAFALISLPVRAQSLGDVNRFPAPPKRSPTVIADRQSILDARTAQNGAILAGNLDSIAAFWTEDVTIRRGLGVAQTGRPEYRTLWIPRGDPDSAVIYQRVPSEVKVSSVWPLAFETGTWVGFLRNDRSHPTIRGHYSAQWVKRNGRWFIRSEVFVALECGGTGCQANAVP